MLFLASAINLQAASSDPLADWHSLQKNNRKFVKNPRFAKQRAKVAGGQNPAYVILGCSDSRVPPELIFDQGLGKLFTTRVAGNTVDTIVVDSIEFAVTTWDVTTLVVMGHTDCGAVIGALARLRANGGVIDVQDGDHLLAVLIPIEEAIIAAGIDINAPNALQLATRANVKYSVDQLLARSAPIRQALADKQIVIVGSEYNLQTGKVKQLFILE